MTVATEGPAATPAALPVAAQNGKREGATLDPDTDTASSGAVGLRSTAAAAAEAPVTGTDAATAVAEAAEPGANSAEAAAARGAAITPARVATATRRSTHQQKSL